MIEEVSNPYLFNKPSKQSPEIKTDRKSRKKLTLCETSVTDDKSSINNFPISPMPRSELWPKSSSKSNASTPDVTREAMNTRLELLLKRSIPQVDREDADATKDGAECR